MSDVNLKGLEVGAWGTNVPDTEMPRRVCGEQFTELSMERSHIDGGIKLPYREKHSSTRLAAVTMYLATRHDSITALKTAFPSLAKSTNRAENPNGGYPLARPEFLQPYITKTRGRAQW